MWQVAVVSWQASQTQARASSSPCCLHLWMILMCCIVRFATPQNLTSTIFFFVVSRLSPLNDTGKGARNSSEVLYRLLGEINLGCPRAPSEKPTPENQWPPTWKTSVVAGGKVANELTADLTLQRHEQCKSYNKRQSNCTHNGSYSPKSMRPEPIFSTLVYLLHKILPIMNT